MKIRFQADADFNEDIVAGVLRREPEVDFRTASEAGLRGLSDNKVLAVVARDKRILVSHDRRSMPDHFAKFIETETSPGVFIASQKTDVIAVIEELLLIWGVSKAEERINRICTIPF